MELPKDLFLYQEITTVNNQVNEAHTGVTVGRTREERGKQLFYFYIFFILAFKNSQEIWFSLRCRILRSMVLNNFIPNILI